MSELQEKQKTLSKELRDANQQRKLAVDDFTDINEKCVHDVASIPKRTQALILSVCLEE